MKGVSIMSAATTFGLCLGLAMQAALAAVPGDACSPNGVAGVNGVMQMTCTSGVWVLNAMKLGNSSVTCNSSNAGYMRWSGSTFEGCNGSSWVQLVSNNLKVYKSDGVTELGNLVGSYDAGCQGLVYANSTTGALTSLNSLECSTSATSGYSVFFSGSNCSGTTYTAASVIGYCCTGSSACTSNLCVANGTVATTPIGSYRSYTGVCTNTSGSSSVAPTRALTCDGWCVVK